MFMLQYTVLVTKRLHKCKCSEASGQEFAVTVRLGEGMRATGGGGGTG